MTGKKMFSLLIASAVTVGMTFPAAAETEDGDAKQLTVFAAASMTETLEELADDFMEIYPDVTISCNFDSSGTLKTQIEEGADCDVFISAAQKQMNELEDGELILSDSRIDLLENKVALAVPEGNPAEIGSFDELAEALESDAPLKGPQVLLAMGNSDVPVGQYTEKILDFYGLSGETLAEKGLITYGSNVKEVTTQVAEASVGCGIIYQTDAYSAGLDVVDTATADMCGQVIYPAAVMKGSKSPDQAKAFLSFLKTPPAQEVFEKVGFSKVPEVAETESEDRNRSRCQ